MLEIHEVDGIMVPKEAEQLNNTASFMAIYLTLFGLLFVFIVVFLGVYCFWNRKGSRLDAEEVMAHLVYT